LLALGGEAQRKPIHNWALAHGVFTTRELAAPSPEKAAGQHPRLVDYYLSWALTNLKQDGLVENPKWSTWRLAGAALEMPVAVTDELVDEARLAELRTMSYALYLNTPEWRRTRAAALLRAGYCCSLNAKHTDRLEVHHNSYERLGAELSRDLAVLCHSCHRLHHKEYGRPRRKQSAKPVPRRKPSLLRRLLAS